ncbi:hypothetical protein ACUN9Y_06935 [Halomonas sp. V046]|uniref:hypothetical protein n=1 Tax=Halomonas sp. V046 TaxID=3459611 RepID=UPI0040443038
MTARHRQTPAPAKPRGSADERPASASAMLSVITGDLIASRQTDTDALYGCLDAALETLAARHHGDFSRFRGDGFQLALADAAGGMSAGVALRAALIAHSPPGQRWDARLAVITGLSVWRPGRSLTDADDAPFIASGRALDALAESDRHLVASDVASDAQGLLIRFLDEMIDNWSTSSAEVVGLCLAFPGITQAALAERLGIRQPSVHKRLQVARWELLSATLAHFHRSHASDVASPHPSADPEHSP